MIVKFQIIEKYNNVHVHLFITDGHYWTTISNYISWIINKQNYNDNQI